MELMYDDRGDRVFKSVDIEWPDWLEADQFTHRDSLLDDKSQPWDRREFVYCCSIKDLSNGGVAAGCYMPAVTYTTAMETMSQHGDEVFDYIEQNLGEIPMPPEEDFRRGQWSGLACWYMSFAVELWASYVLSEIEEAEVADDE